MVTFQYKSKTVPDYQSLIAAPFDLDSPYRSTVPLLAYWADPDSRLAQISKVMPLSGNVTLDFEHDVRPPKDAGRASCTDVMILTDHVAIAVEAKYTEPQDETVRDWLGGQPMSKLTRLNRWLGLI